MHNSSEITSVFVAMHSQCTQPMSHKTMSSIFRKRTDTSCLRLGQANTWKLINPGYFLWFLWHSNWYTTLASSVDTSYANFLTFHPSGDMCFSWYCLLSKTFLCQSQRIKYFNIGFLKLERVKKSSKIEIDWLVSSLTSACLC